MLKLRLISVSLGLLALSGCLDVGGTFQAKTDLVFTQAGFLGSTQKVKVPAGTYGGSLNFEGSLIGHSNDKVVLSLDGVQGHSEAFEFKAPVSDMPVDGSWLEFPATQTGQAYDARVSVLKTVKRDTVLHQEYESCTYQQCQTACDDYTDSHHHHHHDCHDQCTTYNGDRHVEYYYVYTDWDVACKLGVGGSFTDASFTGHRHDVDRDYTYVGQCR